MSRNRRRGPNALNGRAKPIGPVLGLARAEQAIEDPLKHQVRKIINDAGDEEVVSSRTTLDRTRFSSRLLAIAGGGISFGNVEPAITLSPAQRQSATYAPGGDIRFDARQVVDIEQWEPLQDPGTILVVSGCLIKMASVGGAPTRFSFEPQVWDVADVAHHSQGRLALPQN